MDNKSPKNLVPTFFNDTADTYEKVVVTATFGKDRYWKKEILKEISQGNTFLDLACGTGILTIDTIDYLFICDIFTPASALFHNINSVKSVSRVANS